MHKCMFICSCMYVHMFMHVCKTNFTSLIYNLAKMEMNSPM